MKVPDHMKMSSYYALSMLESGIDKNQVKQIIAMAHVKMDEMDPEESYRKVIEKMKGGR